MGKEAGPVKRIKLTVAYDGTNSVSYTHLEDDSSKTPYGGGFPSIRQLCQYAGAFGKLF